MVGAVDEYEDEKTWVMVKDKWLAKSVNAKQHVEVRSQFEVLAVETNKDRKMARTSPEAVGVRCEDGQEREPGGARPGRLVH